MKIKLWVSAILWCTLFSCRKQNNTQTHCEKNVASIAGTYSFVKYEGETNGVFKDLTSEVRACELDDYLTLNKDGSYVSQDAGIVCSSPGNYKGTWSLTPTGQMMLNYDDSYVTYDITFFDCSTFVLTTLADPRSPGRERFTYKK
jgi:hypothetical protein